MYDAREFFGKILKQARIDKGMTQIELADEIGVDLRTVKHHESGKGNPKAETINNYIHVLNICPGVLFSEYLTDEGLKMDHIYRELLELESAQVVLIAEQAIKIKRWKQEHPGE